LPGDIKVHKRYAYGKIHTSRRVSEHRGACFVSLHGPASVNPSINFCPHFWSTWITGSFQWDVWSKFQQTSTAFLFFSATAVNLLIAHENMAEVGSSH